MCWLPAFPNRVQTELSIVVPVTLAAIRNDAPVAALLRGTQRQSPQATHRWFSTPGNWRAKLDHPWMFEQLGL